MAYAERTVWCTRCQRPMRGRYKPRPPWLCWDCSQRKMVDTIVAQAKGVHWRSEVSREQGHELARQIAARSGPRYEAWVRGVHKIADEHPIPPPPCPKASPPAKRTNGKAGTATKPRRRRTPTTR